MRRMIIEILALVMGGTIPQAEASNYGRWRSEPKLRGGEPGLISVAATCASDDEHAPCYAIGCRAGGEFELLVQSPAGWDNVKASVRAERFTTSVIWKDYPKLFQRAGIATAGGPIGLTFLEEIRDEKRLTLSYEGLRSSVTLNGFSGQLAAMKKKCLPGER